MQKIMKGFSVLVVVIFLGISSPSVAQSNDPVVTTQNTDDDDDDNSDKIGLLGLLGLLGLIGLKKNKDNDKRYTTNNPNR